MRLAWSRFAFEDRDAILNHIAKEDIEAALSTDSRIEEAVENLGAFPLMGRLGRVVGTRELVVSKTNFVVAYQIDEAERVVTVLRVLHGAQQWPESFW
jgi:toxin ParE1/3/4